ncbi:MAG: hypothetical protein ACT4QC_05175 [Planctomycetaceae bacterium]
MPLDWLKHAFAIESRESQAPTAAQQAVAERLCRQVVARELTTPALIFLETMRPLNYVTAQAMQFFAPLLGALGDVRAYDEFATFLEQRGSIGWLCNRIEALENERPQRES